MTPTQSKIIRYLTTITNSNNFITQTDSDNKITVENTIMPTNPVTSIHGTLSVPNIINTEDDTGVTIDNLIIKSGGINTTIYSENNTLDSIPVKTEIYSLGSWVMTNNYANLLTKITALTKENIIFKCSILITDDNGTQWDFLSESSYIGSSGCMQIKLNADDKYEIQLPYSEGSVFNNNSVFSDTSINRGYCVISYS